ncbi:MAG: tetratricopeptide repeat protein [Bacteroidales bacterium]|nr:tetratricopeptide repeat protein [Bacteroidales bacterium]
MNLSIGKWVNALLIIIAFSFQAGNAFGTRQNIALARKLDSLFFQSQTQVGVSPEKAIAFIEEALQIAEQINDSAFITACYLTRGEAYRNMGENLLSLENFMTALHLYNSMNDSTGVAKCMDEIGRIYRFLGDYDKALDYHLKALKLFEILENKHGIASSLINSGVVYRNMGYNEKALQNYEEALDISMDLVDTNMMVNALISTGNVYWYMKENQKALFFYQEAFAMANTPHYKGESVSGILNNIGNVYRQMDDPGKALEYYRQSLKLSRETGDKNLIAVTHKNIGIAYSHAGDFSKAREYLEKAQVLAEEIRLSRVMREVLEELSEIYYKTGNYQLALDYFKALTVLKDSIFNEEARDRINTLRLDYELGEKNRENEILQKNLELSGIKALKDRNLRNYLIVISLLIIILTFVIFRRYSEKQRSNEELKRMNASLERRVEERTSRLQEENERRKSAQLQADLANAAKTRFLATINHEVRTPINAIIGFCDLTMRSGLTITQEENLKKVKDSSQHLLLLFKDILDYSQIEAGAMELKESTIDLNEMMNSVLNAFYLDAKSKNILLSLETGNNVPRFIITDHDFLRQVLFNLIGNAIKFTEEGKVEVKVVTIKEYPGTDAVDLEFAVKDTGIGISKFKQKLIFKDFTQEDSSHSRKYGGAGLGLTISKYLTKLMGGDIRVESEKGRGSCFFFTIRARIDRQKSVKMTLKEAEEKKRAENTGC